MLTSSNLSDRIRKAALGPRPTMYAHFTWGWLWGNQEDEMTVARFDDQDEFRWGDYTERRMFLLFVAEALRSEALEE